jgi:hypothetical protein
MVLERRERSPQVSDVVPTGALVMRAKYSLGTQWR